MYRVLFSCPHSAAYSVLARSILRLSWHTWPTVISTRRYSIFKDHSVLLRNCGDSVQISFHLYTASKTPNLSRDFKFFWKFWNVPLIGRQQKEGKDNRVEKVPSIGSQWKRQKYNPFRQNSQIVFISSHYWLLTFLGVCLSNICYLLFAKLQSETSKKFIPLIGSQRKRQNTPPFR